jgi:hypothetical protein
MTNEGLKEREKLYNLELHNTTFATYWEVMRVPGGWIYSCAAYCIFVPYSDDFNPAITF